MNLQYYVHDSLANMLIMAILFVMTAVVMADATPACSYYCKSLFVNTKSPRPVDCDCHSLQEQDSLLKRIKRQVQANQSTFTPQSKGKELDIQRSFTIWNNTYNTTYNTMENESYVNYNKEKDSKAEYNKINDDKIIQIDAIKKCVIVHSILMSRRKLSNTKFKVNLKTDAINNNKHLTDSEIMEIVSKKCNGAGTNSLWNMNNDPTLNSIINSNINLKEDNFSVISESIKLFKDLDSVFLKYKRTSRKQLHLSAPKAIVSTESSTKSRTTTENTTPITVLSDETSHMTPVPKKHTNPSVTILIPEDVTEKIDLPQNITTVENKNLLETSTLNPLLNTITTTNDNTELNNTNLLDQNRSSVGQITESVVELPNDHINESSTKRIIEIQNSMTRNNITSKTLTESTNETAKITTSTINPKNDMNEFRTLANKPKSNLVNDGTFFTRNNYRDYYNESEIPIVRIVTREYPNDTVSSIIDGTEILPNNDFRDEEFRSKSAKVYKIYHIAVPIETQSDNKHLSPKDTEEKLSANYFINRKLNFNCKPKPSGPLKIRLEISAICDETNKQNKSQSILLAILCTKGRE